MGNEYFIFGASGHAKVILDILLSNGIQISAIIDDNPKVNFLLGIPVIHSKDFNKADNGQFIIAVGDNLTRKKIVKNNIFKYFSSTHKDATVSTFADLGLGTVVMPKAVINAEAKIGKHCIINSRSVVEHDCILGDFVHISPNASLAGNIQVGDGTQIGIGASVIQGVKIGKWVTIGAGAVIIKDVPDFVTVVGNPGKVINTK